MDRVIFWDVDTQYDFMMPDGRLYVPDSESLLPTLGRLTEWAHEHGIRIVASADDHVAGHDELSDTPDFRETFPPHCMRGSPGQRKVDATRLDHPLVIEPDLQEPRDIARQVTAHDGDILFHKHRFDVFSNPNVLPAIHALNPEAIVLYGVALDICDRYAVEGLIQHRPHTRLYFVKDAARAIVPEQAEHLLKAWGEEGVRLVTAAEVIDDGVLDGYLQEKAVP
jgi:nicotinamidase/pyrazinamidase